MIGDAFQQVERSSAFETLVDRYKPDETIDVPLPQGELLRFRAVTNAGELQAILKEARDWAGKVKAGRLQQFSEFSQLPTTTLGYAFFLQRTMMAFWPDSEEVTGEDGEVKTEPRGDQEAKWDIKMFCRLALEVAFLFEAIKSMVDMSQVQLQRNELSSTIEQEKKE